MAEPLKNIYSPDFFDQFVAVFGEINTSFNAQEFLADVFNSSWDSLELKDRMRHITECLHRQLPDDFESNIGEILSFVSTWKHREITVGKYDSLAFMFLPDYIEQHGILHFESSLLAMEQITEFASCEFAIRPFIIQYPKQCISRLFQWSNHENLHVRRLASEGSRPRLPWAMALPELKQDPAPILPILENLKSDSSEYVRRSVANNLNDIAKDHPNIVINTAKRWKGQSKETDWIVKHASRTLLKQGNQEVMQLFGFGKVDNMRIRHFEILTPNVKIGNELEFSLIVKNLSKTSSKIRLEYGIYYLKANGSHSKKVFKISESTYEPTSESTVHRRQSFKLITTRKFYPGNHLLSIIVNGVEMDKLEFELVD